MSASSTLKRGRAPAGDRLRLVTQAGNVGTYDVDLTTGEGIWSDSVFDMLGLPVAPDGRARLSLWRSHCHPDDLERAVADSVAAEAHGRLEIEFRVIRADDGETRWLACYGHVLKAGDTPVRSVGVVIDRTQQKHAELALADSEARLRRAQEAGGVGSYEWDMATGDGVLSESMLRIIGLPVGPAYRLKHIIAPVLDEDLPKVLATVEAINGGALRRETEYRIRRVDTGAIRWIRDIGQLELAKDGRPARWCGIVQDVTDKMEALRALSASEERLRLGLAAGRMVAWELDLASGLVSRSENAEAVLGPGTRAEEFFARMDAADAAADQARVAAAIASADGHYESEFRYRHPDGRMLWLHNQGRVLRGADGAVRSLHGVCIDVTARREAEERLRESEARFRGMFESGLMGFSIFDANSGETVAINDRLLAMTGSDRAAFEAGRWDWRAVTPAEFLPRDAAAAEQARRDGRWEPYEKDYVRPDGSRIHVRLLSAPLPDQPGRVFVGVEDITERKRAQDHQKLLINELNHRVKNTLAIVQAIAQQSFREESVAPAARRAFEGRLAALSAAHSLLTSQNWEAASLTQIVGDAIAAVRGRDARVRLEGPDLMLQPKTAVSLAMAIHELATNAVKYGSLSGATGTVDIVWRVDEGRLHLEWRERGGPDVRAPSRRGFGTRMIERGLAAELGGSVAIAFPREGLVCTIDAPLPQGGA